MNRVIIYIHGKGGCSQEAEHYKALFNDSKVIGFDYTAKSPWEARVEFTEFFDSIYKDYKSVIVIANSIGAFFVMSSLYDRQIEKAFFISPIVNMEKLITDMMKWANVTEDELHDKKEIETDFGETLSWKYYCYVKKHPIRWTIQTHILYGQTDIMTSYSTMCKFANQVKATLTVMKNGEHWFHTDEQMKFLDNWMLQYV